MEPDTTTPRRRFPVTLTVWLAGVVAILVLGRVGSLLKRINVQTGVVSFFIFLAWVLVIILSLYGFAVMLRWLLRKLFWTVGRRLFLSYVMIGMLPFLLFGVLLAAILYLIAGVASQSNFRAERQASIGQLESGISEYALQGKRPTGEAAVEVYDSADASGQKIPAWLRNANFSGTAARGEQPMLVVARQFPSEEGHRSIVFAEALDKNWARQLEDRTGMIVAQQIATREGDSFNIGERHGKTEKDEAFNDFGRRGIRPSRNVFFEVTEEGGLMDWDTGAPRRNRRIAAVISNPYRNILQFYFGGATNSSIMKGIFGFITGLTSLLMVIYLFASAFAAVLIFSISRAVNRIEKGTKAVERGDFSYRINMKPSNQLGQMAASFDRMTASIASLLTGVQEKERLQSEIAIAATIQRNLLPREGPQLRGVSFSAHFEPTASIGGDYYDVFNLDKSRLAVAIGDVSGHGLSTGLVMAMVKAAITTLVDEGADETSLFQRLNALVFRSTERRAFMTLAFTVFDLSRGTIRHTNAGHLYPYLLREGVAAPIPIESPSLPLGVRAHLLTQTAEMDLRQGDTVVYLSDGIVEAQDPEGEPFGFDQLEQLLEQQEQRSPSHVRDAILAAVAKHSGDRPADDDRTIMVLRFDSLIGASWTQSAGAEGSDAEGAGE